VETRSSSEWEKENTEIVCKAHQRFAGDAYVEDGNYSTAVCGANTVNALKDVLLGKDNTVTILGRVEVRVYNLTESTLKPLKSSTSG